MWQALTAVAVPLLSLLGVAFKGTGTRLSKRMLHHIELANSLEDLGQARNTVISLIESEAEELKTRELARVARKLNKTNFILALILAALAGASIYFGWAWVSSTYGTGLAFVSVPVTIIVVLTFVVFAAAGLATMFDPPSPKDEK